jgi:endoglycosylceramidase
MHSVIQYRHPSTAGLLVLLISALIGCGDNAAELSNTRPLRSDGTHLRDEQGRVVLLRGVNARVEGLFDVAFSDGRIALEPIPPLLQSDCTRMRQLGFDLLRLPINWSGIEPSRGSYSGEYLTRVDAAIACASNAGMLVVIDLHQDAYSKEIGEDGAPLWAIVPTPAKLLQGPLTDLNDRRLSAPVQAAFKSFFALDDASGLQKSYLAMLRYVATRWANNDSVIGFEVFNEPDTGPAENQAFNIAAAQAVRSAAPEKLVMFEPLAIRNFTDFTALSPTPFPVSGSVYTPHIYTYVFAPVQTSFNNATPAELEGSVRAARDEAAAWKTPLWISEFGCAPTNAAPNALWMQTAAQLHDRYFASDAWWLWKEQSQDAWGVYDFNATDGSWVERPHVVAWVSRVHVARIAGVPKSVESTFIGDSIRIEVDNGSTTAAPHVVYIPERFAATAQATCGGVTIPLVRAPDTGLAELACGGVLVVGVPGEQ